MNQIQNTLEQVYKEYITFKEYTESNKKPIEDLRKEIAEKVIGNEDNILDIVFEIMGDKQLEMIDLNQLGVRLRNFYDAYKDLVEVPANIEEEAKKIDIKFLFAVKNNKRETVDKELYETYKKQFVEANKQAQEQKDLE